MKNSVTFLLFDGVGDEKAGILFFIKQHHSSQVTNALFIIPWTGNQSNTLHLQVNKTSPINSDV